MSWESNISIISMIDVDSHLAHLVMVGVLFRFFFVTLPSLLSCRRRFLGGFPRALISAFW